jgi:hypothetical protein
MTIKMSQETNKSNQRRIEPLRAEPLPPVPENKPKASKLRKFLGKAALAGLFVVPVADLTLSDALAAKEYEVVHEQISDPSPVRENGIENIILGAAGIAESVALGQIISRNKKAQNAFDDFREYQAHRHSTMSKSRRVLSKTVNSPVIALEKMARGFEKVGQGIEGHNSLLLRKLGKVAVETGQVNALGTSAVIMQETMNGKPPTLGRQAYLGALITGSWLTMAEGIRQSYRNIPVLRPPMAALGHTYEALTSMDITDPLSTPVSTLAISATVFALGYTGWRIEEFRQQREARLGVDHDQVQQAIIDFNSNQVTS